MNGYMKSLACCTLLLPALGFAASKAQQEYLDVIAAVPGETHGAELYAEHCASCHGADANGAIEGSTPRIAGQHFRVLVRQLIDFRYGKRWDFRMEAVATSLHKLSDAQDIADVAGYVSALDRSGSRGVGDGTQVARGGTVYGGRCQSCHGIAGEGDNSRSIPKIGGQHAAYLMRQVYDAVDGRRPPLGTTHRQRFVKLDFEDVQGLTDFIARMGWQDAAPADTPDK